MTIAEIYAKRISWRGWRIGLTFVLLLPLYGYPLSTVSAARGAPGSAEFGFGAHLDIWGTETELAIRAAAGIGLDWLALDFDWSKHWANEDENPNLDRLEQVLNQINQYEINVLLSITSSPIWALTPQGPDPSKVVELLSLLVRRYGEDIAAFELFPKANTMLGWGAPPNPQAYRNLLEVSDLALKNLGSKAFLVGAGLLPWPLADHTKDMDDRTYLIGLYRAGAGDYMPVVSIRLGELSSDIFASTGESNSTGLRQYEAVRQVMNEYGHTNGLVWVTAYRLPDTQPEDPGNTYQMQIRWLNQAMLMMKSQLYLGVAFYDQINPAGESTSDYHTGYSLIQEQDGQIYIHPAFSALGHIISTIRTGQNNSFHLFMYKKISSTAKIMMKVNRP